MIAAYDQLAAGLNIRDAQSTLGRAVDFARPRRNIRHAWQTTVAWAPKAKQWQASVAPGYVNGDAPIWRTDVKEQAAHGRDFGTNPLTGLPYFSSFVFSRDTTPVATRPIDIPLYDDPAIPLSGWRDLGEGSATEIIPSILRADTGSETPAKQRRQLRAVDLILHQPRAALTTIVVTGPGLLTGQTFDHQVLTVRPPQSDDTLRVLVGTLTPASALSDADAIDALTGQYEERAYDELLISTVYLRSAPGVPETAQPDATWTPAVKHGLFWNLTWIPAPQFQQLDLTSTPNAIEGLTALGNVLVAPFANTFSAAANDLIQASLVQLQAKSQAGTFFTPTGGGHVFTPPPIAVAATDPLDKTARRKALATAKAQEAQRARAGLDPSFPYTAIGFPVERFNV